MQAVTIFDFGRRLLFRPPVDAAHRNRLSGDVAAAALAGAELVAIRAEEDGPTSQSPAAVIQAAIARQDANLAARGALIAYAKKGPDHTRIVADRSLMSDLSLLVCEETLPLSNRQCVSR